MHTLLIVLNGRECQAFLNDGPHKGLVAVREDLPQSDFDLERDERSDRPGRTFDSTGKGRHAKEPATTTGELAGQRFVATVAKWMERADCVAAADRLILVAPPSALGALRASLSGEIKKKVVADVDKDYTQASIQELTERVLPLAA